MPHLPVTLLQEGQFRSLIVVFPALQQVLDSRIATRAIVPSELAIGAGLAAGHRVQHVHGGGCWDQRGQII